MILPIDKNLSNIPEVHVLLMEMFHVIMHIIIRKHCSNKYPEGGISERRLMGNFGSRCWVQQSWLSIPWYKLSMQSVTEFMEKVIHVARTKIMREDKTSFSVRRFSAILKCHLKLMDSQI